MCFCRKDSVLKPELMRGLTLPVVDSEGESSSSEELEEDQEELPCSDEIAVLESTQTSSWCTIL